MSSHIARIESAIRAHILDNEEDFLGSVGGVSELSRRTEEFRDGVRELRRSFARVSMPSSTAHSTILFAVPVYDTILPAWSVFLMSMYPA